MRLHVDPTAQPVQQDMDSNLTSSTERGLKSVLPEAVTLEPRVLGRNLPLYRWHRPPPDTPSYLPGQSETDQAQRAPSRDRFGMR